MSLRDLLDMARRNLLARKLRTGLTLLGVVIGCVSIILMLSFGYGITANNRRMMEGFGDVKNIQVSENSMETAASKEPAKKITDRSLQEFRKIPHVIDVTPVYNASIAAKYRKYGSDFLSVTAMNKDSYEKMGWNMEKGSFFHGDGEGQVLFGNGVASSFYDERAAVTDEKEEDAPPPFEAAGKTVVLSGTEMPSFSANGMMQTPSNGDEKKVDVKVVGVIEKTKKMQYDNGLFMTIDGYKKLAESLGLPAPERGTYSTVQIRIDDTENAESVSDAIKDLGYEPSGMLEAIKSMNRGMAIVNAIFAGIGSISFIVAAIGIANTMIMSIYERTKEIGVMKVIGASIQDIQKLFLTEAALIGLIGGIIGVVTSLLMSAGFNAIGNRFAAAQGAEEAVTLSYIPPWLVIVALLFSTLVGIAAGYFPARRAMNLSALDAIRSD